MTDLPLHTWIVVDHRSPKIATLISMHTNQDEAEATRDKRNEGLRKPRYTACIVVEPVAQSMGGHFAPTAQCRYARRR
jgi:hypothetical protein